MVQQVLPTQNEGWGFYGTMGEFAQTAWVVAMREVAEATKFDFEAVRKFLDSRFGRHLADDVQNFLSQGDSVDQAVKSAVAKHMAWTISRHTSRQLDIPFGLPYLTGFVGHCANTAE